MSVGKGRPQPSIERQHREACKPVRADEITAGQSLPAGGEVTLRGVTRHVDSWIARGQRPGDACKAPCAREIETVEVHELRVGAIDDIGGREQRGRRTIGEARQ